MRLVVNSTSGDNACLPQPITIVNEVSYIVVVI